MILMFASALILRFVSLIVIAQPRNKAWFKRTAIQAGPPKSRSRAALELACGICFGLSLTSFTPQSPWGGSYRVGIVSGAVGVVLLIVVFIKGRRKKFRGRSQDA